LAKAFSGAVALRLVGDRKLRLTMLSVFEYPYRAPGGKLSGGRATHEMISPVETKPPGSRSSWSAKPRDFV